MNDREYRGGRGDREGRGRGDRDRDRDRGPDKKREPEPDYIDYKDVPGLRRYLNAQGKMHSRKRTRVSAQLQHKIKSAVKRARFWQRCSVAVPLYHSA